MHQPKDENGLTAKQKSFVSEYIRTGGQGKLSAVNAGYAEGSAAVRSYELLQMDHIQQALAKEMQRALAATGPLAMEALVRLVKDPNTPASVIASASIALLDRSGHRHPQRIEIEARMDERQRRAEIARLIGGEVERLPAEWSAKELEQYNRDRKCHPPLTLVSDSED